MFSPSKELSSWCYFDSNYKTEQMIPGYIKIYEFQASEYTYYSSSKMGKLD